MPGILTLGGVKLVVPSPATAAEVEARISHRHVYQHGVPHADVRTWPGRNRLSWPWPGYIPHPPRIRTGILHWPPTASRWAVFHGLASGADLALLRVAAYGAAGNAYNALPLVLADGRTGKTISPSLYLLPSRPVFQSGTGNRRYLVTAVCPRLFWWEKAASIVVTAGTTTWAALIDSIASALGVTITVDSISANYLKPPADFTARYEALPLLLDAVLSCIGHRLVAKLDGTYVTQAALTAKTSKDAQKGLWPSVAGGSFDLDATKAPQLGDLDAAVPASVLVSFPRQDSGIPNATPYTVTTSLASLSLSQFAGVTARPGTKVLRDSAVAYHIAGVLQNTAELASLATQITTDWYRWRLGDQDVKYAGIVPYIAEGYDVVEWCAREQEYSTRVQRFPDDMTEDLLHLGVTYGSQETCCGGTTTTGVDDSTPTTFTENNYVTRGTITAPTVTSTGYRAETLPTPPTAPGVVPHTTGSSTVTYKYVYNIPGGGTTPPSPPTAITNAPATITSTDYVGITMTPPPGVPPDLLQTVTYTLYRVATNTTSNPNGPFKKVGPFKPGETPTAIDEGETPDPLLPQTPLSTNTTGQASASIYAGVNVLPLPAPQPPTITNVGTPGVTTYTYEVTANDGTGETTPSATGTTTTGDASPDADNYPLVTWGDVPGALSYNVYRTVGGASQGLLATVLAGQPLELADTALVAGAAAPVTNTTGQIKVNGVAVTPGGGLTVGVTAIASGTDTYILYNNAGVLGNKLLTGSDIPALADTSQGDGSDGNVTFADDGVDHAGSSHTGSAGSYVYSLTRDIFCGNLTINATVTLKPAGFRVFCAGTFTNNGTLSAVGGLGGDGSAGSGGTGGARGGGVGTYSAQQGALAQAGGHNGVGNPGGGLAGVTGYGSAGGNGGTSGTNGGGSGGAGPTAPTAVQGSVRVPPQTLEPRSLFSVTQWVNGGGAGGSGGSSSANNGGGGGGGGAGCIFLAAKTLINNSTITAEGGGGGNAGGSSGGAGGGGGGGGGLIVLIYGKLTNTGSITVAGGTHGALFGTGSNGVDGTSGVLVQIPSQ